MTLDAGRTETGRLIRVGGAVLQRGPFHSLWIRVGGDARRKVSAGALEELVSTSLSDQAALKVPGAVYVALDERSISSEHVQCLHRCGFRFHHHRTSPEPEGDEFVYYRWPDRPDFDDKVPSYSTATEGVGALVLSPDEKRILLVWEYGCWKMVTGSVDAGEGTLQAMRRELQEEVGLREDAAFKPVYLGGWQASRAYDRQVNNHFSVYAVRVQDEATQIDTNEIGAARWFDLAALRERAAAADAASQPASSRMPLDVSGLSPGLQADGPTPVSTTLLHSVETLQSGRGLHVTEKVTKQGSAVVQAAVHIT